MKLKLNIYICTATIFAILLCSLIVFANSKATASDDFTNLCEDTFLRFERDPEDCTRYFMCMLSSIVWFRCDEGKIFVPEYRNCFVGDPDTCELIIEPYAQNTQKKLNFKKNLTQ